MKAGSTFMLCRKQSGEPSFDAIHENERDECREGRAGRFHFAFSLFRLAVIFEGIAFRARGGVAVGDNAAEVGRLSATFARRAVEALDGAD